jgi:hypothetical protein
LFITRLSKVALSRAFDKVDGECPGNAVLLEEIKTYVLGTKEAGEPVFT